MSIAWSPWYPVLAVVYAAHQPGFAFRVRDAVALALAAALAASVTAEKRVPASLQTRPFLLCPDQCREKRTEHEKRECHPGEGLQSAIGSFLF